MVTFRLLNILKNRPLLKLTANKIQKMIFGLLITVAITSCDLTFGVLYAGFKNPYIGRYEFNANYKDLKTNINSIRERKEFALSEKWKKYMPETTSFDEFYIVLRTDTNATKEVLLKVRYYGDDAYKDSSAISQIFIAGVVYPGNKWNDNPGRKTERIIKTIFEEQFLLRLNMKYISKK